MAIDIQNDLPQFTVTDTLHQLVDKLNDLETALTSNNSLLDSAVNDLLFMVHRDSGVITSDGTLTLDPSGNLIVDASAVRVNSSAEFSVLSNSSAEIRSLGKLTLRSHFDGQNIELKGNDDAVFGRIANDDGDLRLDRGFETAVTFADGDAIFPGTITVPASTLNTVDNTIQGAINEIHDEISVGATSLVSRLDTIEGDITALETLTNGHTSTLDTHETRLNTFDALNIANRLNTIESKITSIETRLGLLGV